jgi:hypothetical protein
MAVVAALLAGCAGPTITADATQTAAETSLRAMASALQTADLAARAQLDKKSWWQATDVMVSDAEATARSLSSTFASRQPPTQSAEMYHDTTEELARAAQLVTDLRVATRHRDVQAISRLLPPIEKHAHELDRQAEALR